MSRNALHPYDVAVALRLLEVPKAAFKSVARDLGLSDSTVHGSVQRLLKAGLVRISDDGARPVNRRALLEFLEHGVKYAFPGVLGAPKRGVPTAHAGPALNDEFQSEEPMVWPDPQGSAFGPAIEPLLPKAAELAVRYPSTYALLTAVDAIRVGRARERSLATAFLRQQLVAD